MRGVCLLSTSLKSIYIVIIISISYMEWTGSPPLWIRLLVLSFACLEHIHFANSICMLSKCQVMSKQEWYPKVVIIYLQKFNHQFPKLQRWEPTRDLWFQPYLRMLPLDVAARQRAEEAQEAGKFCRSGFDGNDVRCACCLLKKQCGRRGN